MEVWAGSVVMVLEVKELTPEISGIRLKVDTGTQQIWGFHYCLEAKRQISEFERLVGKKIRLTKVDLRTSASGKVSLMINAFEPPALRSVLRCCCGLLLWYAGAPTATIPLTTSMILDSTVVPSAELTIVSPVNCRQCGTLLGYFTHATPAELRHLRSLVQVSPAGFTTEYETTESPQVLEISKRAPSIQIRTTLDLEIAREVAILKAQVSKHCRN
jgi:hypothetical protein